MQIEVSLGEFIDKVSILEIKQKNIRDENKLAHVSHELAKLYPLLEHIRLTPSSLEFQQLLAINETLWQLENRIRAKEKQQTFDDEFISIARQIYISNDERAAIKNRINTEYRSEIVEEKEYFGYRD